MRYIAALSGGVDSSAAAALAVAAGHEVIGVTLRLKHPDPAFAAAQSCAPLSDEEAVRGVAAKLGIECRFIDYFPEFRDLVLHPAALEYAAGRTPNPCCFCNERVKFAALFAAAADLGADRVLTGHYARFGAYHGRRCLRRGADSRLDQSYFLYRLPPEQLDRLDFPVGEFAKDEVRRIAAAHDLPTASRPDSQDACFQVPGECFGETLRRLFALPARPGRFVYRGREVGRHDGIHRYTIGQRKGLNVALGQPAYIVAVDPASGDIELDIDPARLEADAFTVDQLTGGDFPEEAAVQIRFRSAAVPAQIAAESPHVLRVTPATPLRAVTPGQAAVFYSGDLLIGGGIIRSAESSVG